MVLTIVCSGRVKSLATLAISVENLIFTQNRVSPFSDFIDFVGASAVVVCYNISKPVFESETIRSVRRLPITAIMMIVSPAVYAQSSPEAPAPSPSQKVAASLERHKAILSGYFAPRRATQYSDDMDSSGHAVASPQFASSVEFDSGRSLSGEGGYYFATKDGRDLEVQEWTLGFRANEKLGLWFGHQQIDAKGRTRPIRPTFNTADEHYGLRYQLTGDERKGVSLQYDRYVSGTGFVTDNAGTSATLPGPKTDSFNLVYHFRRNSEDQDSPALPGYRLRLNYANVRGAGAGATEIGAGAGMTFKVARNLYGDGDIMGYREARSGSTSGTNFRLHLNGGLTFQPVQWVKLQVGADVYPGGAPFGGSSITGLSSFGVYQSNDGASGISSGLVAVLNVRLVVGKRF